MGAWMSVNEQTQKIEIGWQVWGKRKERRRLEADVAAAEAKEAARLAEMRGRMCSNGVTMSCCLHTKRGSKGPVNQDSMLVWEGFVSTPGSEQQNNIFCGVFDGHGPNGHHVSKKVRDGLPSMLLASLQHDHDHDQCEDAHNIDNTTEEENPAAQQESLHSSTILASNDNKSHNNNNTRSHGQQQPFFSDSRFISAFNQMDDCLKSHPTLNCHHSGTTAIAIIIQGHELVVGNVGDSRAIMAQRDEDGTNLIIDQLTIDLKPNLLGEQERIESFNGRVFPLRTQPHVARLWLPHVDSPGLCMSRALGDFCLKDYGLICTPQISRRIINEHHEFLVLATDGVWDVLSNEEVVKIVFDCEVKEKAAKSIVNEARRRWRRKERALEGRMDDCAVVCHFFKQDLNQYMFSSNKKGIRKFLTSKHKFGYLCSRKRKNIKDTNVVSTTHP